MQNSALSLSQLLSGNQTTQGAKKGTLNLTSLLGVGNSGTTDAFQSLLGALASANAAATTTGPAQILSTTPEGQSTNPDALLGLNLETVLDPDMIAALSPDVLAVLKTLDLQSISTLQLPTSDLPEEIQTIGILDALSSAGHISDSDVFTLIEDPELANALASLVAQLRSLQQPTANTAPKTDATNVVKKVSATIPTNIAPTALLQAVQAIEGHLEFLSDTTITIDNVADLDLDQFQLLKKLAFADIAPYLSQPRKIRVDDDTVAKVAQGPGFLSVQSTDVTTLSVTDGLAPALSPVQPGDVEFIHDPLKTQQLQNGQPLTAAQGPLPASVQPGITPTTQPTAKNSAQAPNATLPTGAANTALGNQNFNAASGEGEQQFSGQRKNDSKTPNLPTKANPVAAIATSAPGAAAQAVQALHANVTPNTSASRGFELAANDGNLLSLDTAFSALASDDLNIAGLSIRADQSLPTNTATSLIAARSAGQPHPSTHLVSITLQRMANQTAGGQDREYTIRMDPPNMGRVKITMEFGKDNMVKARLLAERPETLSLLQKDAHTLERALQASGLDTSDANTLSFDLAEGDSFEQNMHDNTGQNSSNGKENGEEDEFGTDDALIETVMPIFTDPVTGLTHVNIVI